jgi:SAM-dependent methyltransferase
VTEGLAGRARARAPSARKRSLREAAAGASVAPRGAGSPWYSFDPIAGVYDATRLLDDRTVGRALADFARRFPPREFPRALEMGTGTGRLAFPFASVGYQVTGVDRSRAMLDRLRARTVRHAGARVRPVRADLRSLPFRSGSFDLAYAVHVFHLVPRWRRAIDETLRVVRPRGLVALGRTEGGAVLPGLTERDLRVVRRLGFPRPRLGARRTETVLRYLAQRGCRVRPARRIWKWSAVATRGASMDYLERRAFTIMRYVPPSVHARALRRVEAWARDRWPDADAPVRFEGSIRFALARLPARSVVVGR